MEYNFVDEIRKVNKKYTLLGKNYYLSEVLENEVTLLVIGKDYMMCEIYKLKEDQNGKYFKVNNYKIHLNDFE